ncbi:phage holin family protein [Pseudomonas aeruginosa]|nr:phage holin family protein [Pseudomonas aeruginosa]MBP8384908.1 phage holin family protein [Pseudomonas aeruginosa]MBP8425386.1 phage holin family protein [Pseudomonas aeruginosa]HEK1241683.1 phage holin family protein [Pseudomonas aeruginosa]
MSEGKDPADGRPSLRRFGAAFLGLLHGHVELFGIELQEQKANTLRLLLFAGLALVFALLLLVGLSLLVLIVFWDTNRLAAALGLCLFYVIGSLFCGWRLYQSINDESSPFSATLEELANDRERLLAMTRKRA